MKDLVFKKVMLNIKEVSSRTLGLTYKSPYQVMETLRPITYQLIKLNGKALSHP